MSDANEMVAVELSVENRQRLYGILRRRIGAIDRINWESLSLGFEFPPGWPLGTSEIQFSQFVVLAKKLKMRIHIRDLEMTLL